MYIIEDELSTVEDLVTVITEQEIACEQVDDDDDENELKEKLKTPEI